MLDTILTGLLAGSALTVTLKVAAVVVGFGLGVRLLAAGGRTVDERERVVLDAVRRHHRPKAG